MPSDLRRLDQVLSSLGYCSRRGAREFLKTHVVSAGAERIKQGAVKVDPAVILVDGEPIDQPGSLLVLMNKPAGYVCSHDAHEGASIYDLLPPRWLARNPRPESVGRLDKDTTGVILLTDDGTLNHRWTSPQHHVEKVYRVTVDTVLDEGLIPQFASDSIQLEGEERPCRPALLEIIDETTARLILTEGKYHQVKRMFAHFGYTVTALHRERFGPHTADGLFPGQWRLL